MVYNVIVMNCLERALCLSVETDRLYAVTVYLDLFFHLLPMAAFNVPVTTVHIHV